MLKSVGCIPVPILGLSPGGGINNHTFLSFITFSFLGFLSVTFSQFSSYISDLSFGVSFSSSRPSHQNTLQLGSGPFSFSLCHSSMMLPSIVLASFLSLSQILLLAHIFSRYSINVNSLPCHFPSLVL